MTYKLLHGHPLPEVSDCKITTTTTTLFEAKTSGPPSCKKKSLKVVNTFLEYY